MPPALVGRPKPTSRRRTGRRGCSSRPACATATARAPACRTPGPTASAAARSQHLPNPPRFSKRPPTGSAGSDARPRPSAPSSCADDEYTVLKSAIDRVAVRLCTRRSRKSSVFDQQRKTWTKLRPRAVPSALPSRRHTPLEISRSRLDPSRSFAGGAALGGGGGGAALCSRKRKAWSWERSRTAAAVAFSCSSARSSFWRRLASWSPVYPASATPSNEARARRRRAAAARTPTRRSRACAPGSCPR